MKRGKYGEIGVTEIGRNHAGLLLAILGWVILTASVFLDRADDYFYSVDANTLITYQPAGYILGALLIVLAMTLVFAWRSESFGLSATAAVIFGICLVMAILAANNLGAHRVESGFMPNEAAAGTTLSIVGASLGLIGSALAVTWSTSSRRASS